LNGTNKAAIKKRMALLRRKVAMKFKKMKQIRIRIERFRLKKLRVRKLHQKYKFSIDLKKKKEIEDEEKAIDAQLAKDEAEEVTVTAEHT
jgi:hypothetical protein